MPLSSPAGGRTAYGPRARAAVVVAACLAVLGPATVVTAAPVDPYDDRALQQQIEQLEHSDGGPPGVIAVLQRDRDTRVLRAGVADLATGRPPQINDHMRIASTARAFSGAVALSLVHRHRLRLDETLGERLPQLPRAWSSVTLRQLLNHTSGLPDYSEDPEFLSIVTADPRHHFDSRHLLDFVADEPLLFPPGSRYHYSDSDNIAVALMAEAATGTRYEQLLRELVYRPLGCAEPACRRATAGPSRTRTATTSPRPGRRRTSARSSARPGCGRPEGSSPRRPT
jgi:D-alanyl-D-alanine carboxypeptidase